MKKHLLVVVIVFAATLPAPASALWGGTDPLAVVESVGTYPAALVVSFTYPVPVTVDTIDTASAMGLDSANAAFSAAYLAKDWRTIVAMYTKDGVLHPPAGGVLVGQGMISEYWQPIENGSQNGHRLEDNYRRMLGPGRVLELGRWHSRQMRDGTESAWSSGCYTVIWEQQGNGRWLIAYDGWTNPIEEEWACTPRIE